MKNKAYVIYPDIHSAIRYVPHNDDSPIPIPPDNLDSSSELDDENEINDIYQRNTFPLKIKEILTNQHDLNELTRDKNLLNYLGLD